MFAYRGYGRLQDSYDDDDSDDDDLVDDDDVDDNGAIDETGFYYYDDNDEDEYVGSRGLMCLNRDFCDRKDGHPCCSVICHGPEGRCQRVGFRCVPCVVLSKTLCGLMKRVLRGVGHLNGFTMEPNEYCVNLCKHHAWMIFKQLARDQGNSRTLKWAASILWNVMGLEMYLPGQFNFIWMLLTQSYTIQAKDQSIARRTPWVVAGVTYMHAREIVDGIESYLFG